MKTPPVLPGVFSHSYDTSALRHVNSSGEQRNRIEGLVTSLHTTECALTAPFHLCRSGCPYMIGAADMSAQNHDDNGAPGAERGFFPAGVRAGLLQEARSLSESRGWDVPFVVIGVRWAAPPRRLTTDLGAAALHLEVVMSGSHPVLDLPGERLPRTFDAAILVNEGWEYPERLHGLTLEELQIHGSPSELPDRVEVRVLTLVTRSGQEETLFLRYQDRNSPPEEVHVTARSAGRVHDVFRRYVGLPVPCPTQGVKHLMGRLWIQAVIDALHDREPDTPPVSPSEFDPLHAYVSGFTDPESGFADALPDGLPQDAIEGLALMIFDGITWGHAREACLTNSFPVPVPARVAQWSDEGLLGRFVLDQVPTQGELLDALVEKGLLKTASDLYVALRDREWLETPTPYVPEEPQLLTHDDPCSCDSGARYGECHGLPA